MSDPIEFGWSQQIVFSNTFLRAIAIWEAHFEHERTRSLTEIYIHLYMPQLNFLTAIIHSGDNF